MNLNILNPNLNKYFRLNNGNYFQYTNDVVNEYPNLEMSFGEITEVSIDEFILNVASNVYIFGSHVYGTNNKDSDIDYIVVFNDYDKMFDITPRYISTNNDYHFYTEKEYQMKLDNMDIQILETYFSPKQFILKNDVTFTFNFNEDNLRKSISTISSNSYVKAKKKLIVAGDYDLKCGLKSLFHSIRIVDYGLQIARDGKISKFDNYNYILDDINKMALIDSTDVLWSKIDTKYRKVFNSISTDFKKNCKKRNNTTDFDFINNLLKEYDIKEHLIHDIIKYFK